MDDNDSRIKASLQLFCKLNCISSNFNGDFDDLAAALVLVDVEKMRCHLINCLIALYSVETQNEKTAIVADNDDYELVKCKIFNASLRMILDQEFDSDEADINTILSDFPLLIRKRYLMNKVGCLSILLSHLL